MIFWFKLLVVLALVIGLPYSYISYFGEVKTHYLRRHYVERTVNQFQPKGKVLEIGSGKNWRYVEDSITFNRDESAQADVIGDAENMVFEPGTFDTIYCLEVIEHTKEPQKIINEIHRTLKDGGQVLLTVPFMFEIHDEQDYRRFTKQGLEYLFRDFSQVEVTPNGGMYSTISHLIRSTQLGGRTYRFWNNLGHLLDKNLPRDDVRFTLGYSVVAIK